MEQVWRKEKGYYPEKRQSNRLVFSVREVEMNLKHCGRDE